MFVLALIYTMRYRNVDSVPLRSILPLSSHPNLTYVGTRPNTSRTSSHTVKLGHPHGALSLGDTSKEVLSL